MENDPACKELIYHLSKICATDDSMHQRKHILTVCCIKTERQRYEYTVVPRPLSNDPRLFQCIYRYSHASKRFVEVYLPLGALILKQNIFVCKQERH